MRAPDGTWTSDPADPDVIWGGWLTGSDDAEVWTVTAEGVVRREPDGTWTDMGAAADAYDTEGIHVFGPDDVVVLRADHRDCVDCPEVQTPVLLWWDGVAWTEDELPPVDGGVGGMTVLPDRTVVLLAGGELRTVGVGGALVAIPPGLGMTGIVSAPDGTLVAVGVGGVGIGTVAGGLALHDPGPSVYEWTDAWASSATDVWVSGMWWEDLDVRHGTIAHWNGASWEVVVPDHVDATFRLAGHAGQLFAVGGGAHEVVLVGDESGLAVERESWGPSYLLEIAVDDVAGDAWSVGYDAVLGHYTAGSWTGVPFPFALYQASSLAVSAGRLVVEADEELHVLDGGAVTVTTIPSTNDFDLAAAGGVLFAARRDDLGPDVLMEAGAGWVPLDVGGLPADAEPSVLWAGRADDLWLGFETGDRGALARWDGVSFTVVADDLSVAPGWIGRMSDGEVYFTQRPQDIGEGQNPLWVYDGAVAAPVPDMPPDVRAAHRLSDGTWFVSVYALRDDDDSYGRLLRRDPGAPDWVEVFEDDGGITLAGLGNTIWAERGPLGWTQAPCAP